MSLNYDEYLAEHKTNVVKGFNWLCAYLPDLVEISTSLEHQIVFAHDRSKNEPAEYDAYDRYFYGGNRTYSVVQGFKLAWLHHIHNNPHHWQHWILINDDPKERSVCLEMPYNYVVEMICDWWSFSWAKGNLYEIFDWWEEHKAHIQLHAKTRQVVEDILEKMYAKLEEEKA